MDKYLDDPVEEMLLVVYPMLQVDHSLPKQRWTGLEPSGLGPEDPGRSRRVVIRREPKARVRRPLSFSTES